MRIMDVSASHESNNITTERCQPAQVWRRNCLSSRCRNNSKAAAEVEEVALVGTAREAEEARKPLQRPETQVL